MWFLNLSKSLLFKISLNYHVWKILLLCLISKYYFSRCLSIFGHTQLHHQKVHFYEHLESYIHLSLRFQTAYILWWSVVDWQEWNCIRVWSERALELNFKVVRKRSKTKLTALSLSRLFLPFSSETAGYFWSISRLSGPRVLREAACALWEGEGAEPKRRGKSKEKRDGAEEREGQVRRRKREREWR